MEEKKDKSFVIRDKRIFDESGDVRRDAQPEPEATAAESGKASERPMPADEPMHAHPEDALPEVNFINFVLSLSTTAMYHFGDFPGPESLKSDRNLAAAKQTIDLLGMIKSKTEGNLDENERALIDGLLFELRMRYVKERERP